MKKSKFETGANVKFLVKLGWTTSVIMETLHTVYGDNAPERIAVFE